MGKNKFEIGANTARVWAGGNVAEINHYELIFADLLQEENHFS
jgi:hypothetical protein